MRFKLCSNDGLLLIAYFALSAALHTLISPLRGWRRGGVGLLVVPLMTLVVVRVCAQPQSDVPEIALVYGEPYEDMRKRSSAKIDPAIPGHAWYNVPKSDARLRFADPQYGFVTPPARFFTVGFDEGKVGNIHLSPQIAPLPLDDALKIVLDLQEQWRKGGWKQVLAGEWPAFADTPSWRESLLACKPNSTYWQAGGKYQTHLSMNCFEDDKHPNEQRYLISLDISKAWIENR